MIEIARETDNSGILQREIAERQNLSIKYLDHIIAALKVSGLITNYRGRKSGYIITRPATEITLHEIYSSFNSTIEIVSCLNPTYQCDKESHCAVKPFYDGLNKLIVDYLDSFTLHQLMTEQITLEAIENISIGQENNECINTQE